MPEPKSPLKVFLCHASADKPKVRELYRYLRKRGIKPWFDEMDLVGGQDWQVEIPKALFSSDAILICLTKNAIDKEGYIQKEIKFALDKALEMPEGRIFLIPVRFEECEVPFALSRYQWVDLFDEVGYTRMMRALKFRAAQLERASVEVQRNSSAEEKPEGEDVGREKLEAASEDEVAAPLLTQKTIEKEYTAEEQAADEVVEPQIITRSSQEEMSKEHLFFPRLIKQIQHYSRVFLGLLLLEGGVLMILQAQGYINNVFAFFWPAVLIWLGISMIFLSFIMTRARQ